MRKLIVFILVLFVFSACNRPVQHSPGDTKTSDNNLKVAVFAGNGASSICVLETIEALKIDSAIKAETISAAEIQKGMLGEFDVIIFPGGSGSKELNNLGQSGIEIIREFVQEKGKGIVGICAGSYILTSTSGYPSLALSSSEHIDRDHYNRGRGLIEIKLSSKGDKIFPEIAGKRVFLQYYDGPVLAPIETDNGPYTELAGFVTDIHPDNYAPVGITPGETFMFNQQSGNGKLISISGHPESTPGMRWLVPRMARWAAGSELSGYDKKWIRPEINDSAIFFDKANKRLENRLFWRLFDDDPQIQIQAMDKLYQLRSRPAVRWYMGMLRDKKAEIRKRAAELLKLCEYTAALPDLTQCYRTETNNETKDVLSEAIVFLGGEKLMDK
ncbi:MAG: BPL-N domain-containing protein [Bacteroidota bacterium]|nr:BPL-N domain-containing protein [Bacteroidota bacterium]